MLEPQGLGAFPKLSELQAFLAGVGAALTGLLVGVVTKSLW